MLNIKVIGANELALYLNQASNGIETQIKQGLKEISDHLHDEVKNKFGKYQESWPKLKRASVIAKYRKRALTGFNRPKLNNKAGVKLGADDPLVLSGELHDSIKKKSNSKEAVVYSDNPYSAVHEYGYAPKGVPARSYMRLTLMQEEPSVLRIMDAKIRRVIR